MTDDKIWCLQVGTESDPRSSLLGANMVTVQCIKALIKFKRVQEEVLSLTFRQLVNLGGSKKDPTSFKFEVILGETGSGRFLGNNNFNERNI